MNVVSRMVLLLQLCALPTILSSLFVMRGMVAMSADMPVTYEQNILPLFREKCCSCHNPDKTSGGLDLSSFLQTLAGGSSGKVILPGDAEGSYLWQLVSHASEPSMPPESEKISDEMLSVIKAWISAGALERSGSAPIASAQKTSDFTMAPGTLISLEGPPIMPPRLSLEVVVEGLRGTSVTAMASSPHGPLVAIGGREQVLLYSTETLELIGVLPFPEGDVNSLRFSRNAKLLIAGGGRPARSGRVVAWDISSGIRVAELGDEFDEVLVADLSGDQRLVAIGGPSRVVRLLQTVNGSTESEIKKHTDWVTTLEFSPDSVLLATGDRAGNLFLWESTGAREYALLRGHTGSITGVAWRPDGAVLASVSEDGTCRLWDADGGSQNKSWNAHSGGALGVVWLGDGRLITCGRDNKFKLWKSDGVLERDFEKLADIGIRVSVSSDSTKVLASDWTGSVVVHDISNGKRIGSIDSNPVRLEKRLLLARHEVLEHSKAIIPADNAFTVADIARTTAIHSVQTGTQIFKELSSKRTMLLSTIDTSNAEKKKLSDDLKMTRESLGDLKASIKKAESALEACRVAAKATPDDAAVVEQVIVAEKNSRQAKEALETVQKSIGSAKELIDQLTKQIVADSSEKVILEAMLEEIQSKLTADSIYRDETIREATMHEEAVVMLRKKISNAELAVIKWQNEIDFAQSQERSAN